MLTTAGREAEAMAWSKARTKSERFQATLAGLLELEVLRAKHKQMVEMALGSSNHRAKPSQDVRPGSYQYWLDGNSSRLRLTRSLSEETFDDLERCETAQSWSRHSSEDLLLDSVGHSDEGPGPRVQHAAAAWDDSSSRASSGFCEDDMSEMCSEDADVSFLSNSFAPLFAQNAPEVSGTLRPIAMKRAEQHREVRDDGAASSCSQEVIPQDGFFLVASLYPDSRWPDVSEILQPQVVLESRYRSDLRSHQGAEVYRYPSPLHAVALQSPLYAPRGPINLNRSLERSTLRPGLRPASVYLCSHFDFVGINSECLPTSMSLVPPGRACQMLPRVPCEKHRLEILITRLAKCSQHLKNQPPVPRPQRGNPASSLHRTCSMGKGRILDSKHKALKRGEKTNTMSDCTSVSSPRTLQNMKRAMCTNQSAGAARGDADTELLSNAPDEECVGVSGSKKSREAQDMDNQEEQASPGIGIFSPGCTRRRSSVVSELPVELASLRV
ncbi:60S ribosomal protein L22-like 1 isoform X2 [Sardina pilchardus]